MTHLQCVRQGATCDGALPLSAAIGSDSHNCIPGGQVNTLLRNMQSKLSYGLSCKLSCIVIPWLHEAVGGKCEQHAKSSV